VTRRPSASPHDVFRRDELCRRGWPWLLALLTGLLACSGCSSYRSCNAPPPTLLQALPRRLSETGFDVELPGAGLRAYEPAFALWSDGAKKQRWVSLPSVGSEPARIDTSDMDDWSFPTGTRFYKEFSVAGRRIETRLLVKVGPAPEAWAGGAYVWDADQSDATLMPEGLKDADGHGYEVPSAADCGGCHGGRKSHVLGFSALQLAKPGLPLTLDDLVKEGRLTSPPLSPPAIVGNDVERSALGYLHANCGHCHNRERPARGAGPRCYDPQRSIDFWLPSVPPAEANLASAVTTTVPRFVTPGEPDASRLIALVSRRGFLLHMPPLASHQVDVDGVARLRAWIEGMEKPR
jgi:hypothetical protein